MKRIISICIIAAMLLSSVSGFAQTNKEQDVTALLSELSVMKGDPDGNFRLDAPVSRAEFAKIAISMSAYRNSVASNLTISPFKDVLYSHWAAPYIKLAVQHKICSGYPDGTFGPDSQVLYEEAVTMLLKVLGYTDSDFGISWPYGQTGLAANLELNENVSKGIGDTLTRGDVAVLAYNTLNTKMKNSQHKQISVFDCEIVENVTLIATTKEDPAVNAGKVMTTGGLFDIKKDFNGSLVGRRGDLVVKNGDDFVFFAPYEQTVNSYTVTSVIGSDLVLDGKVLKIDENLLTYYKSQQMTYRSAVNLAKKGDTFVTYSNTEGVVEYAVLLSAHSGYSEADKDFLRKYVVFSKLENKIVAYRDGVFEELDISDITVVYQDKVITTFSLIKPLLDLGDILYIKYDANGDIEYVSYEKGSVTGPVTVKTADWITAFNASNDVTVMRDGKRVNALDIKLYDVVYYSKDLNMILAYSDKVTGVYEKALPNKDIPKSVVISGTTYSIEGVNAFGALSSNGRFDFGETVTILLGKTGQVADVISPGEAGSAAVTGYLFETGKKEFTRNDEGKYTGYYIKVALPGGQVNEYVADKNYEDIKNAVVEVSFKNGVAQASTKRSAKTVSGVFDWSAKKIGTEPVSYSVKILDVSTIESYNAGFYTSVFPQRIDGMDFVQSNILFAGINDKNEIESIILNNVTGDSNQYGVVIEASNKTAYVAGKYKYDIDGKTTTINTVNVAYSVGSGPAKFSFDSSGQVNAIRPLEKISGSLNNVTNSYVETKDGKYLLSDRVVVYKKTYESDYMLIPLKDIIGKNTYTLYAYQDKPEARGGRVRVIIATEK